VNINTRLLIPLLCVSCAALVAADDERCSSQKTPCIPDITIVNTQPEMPQPELCPCSVKPRAEEETELCPCNVKPRIEEEQELCPCSVKPRVDEDTELCPCSVKPRVEESPELCPCSVKPKKVDPIKNVYAYLHNQPKASLQSHKPKITHKDIIERACNCTPKSHKLTVSSRAAINNQKPTTYSESGAALFIESTHALMNCVEGGIVANNTGNLKEGLPYILEGIQTLINIASKSPNPQKSYQDIIRFISDCDQTELDMLFGTIKTH